MGLVTVRRVCFLLWIASSCGIARADLAVIVAEPYGTFGAMLPVGHAAVYLDRICADGPTRLRICSAGESGSVIARYHRVGNADWVVTPVFDYLYGVDRIEDLPSLASRPLARSLQDRYWREHLQQLVPARKNGVVPRGEWTEGIGVTFYRRLWVYRIATTEQQDRALLSWIERRANKRSYRLRTANCADFVAGIVNFYYPHSIEKNSVGDMGMMTPKQLARSMQAFDELHPGFRLQRALVPQLSGTLRRSRPVRGAWELFIRQKRYLVPLLILQPEMAAVAVAMYAAGGKFNFDESVPVASPQWWSQGNMNTILQSPRDDLILPPHGI